MIYLAQIVPLAVSFYRRLRRKILCFLLLPQSWLQSRQGQKNGEECRSTVLGNFLEASEVVNLITILIVIQCLMLR